MALSVNLLLVIILCPASRTPPPAPAKGHPPSRRSEAGLKGRRRGGRTHSDINTVVGKDKRRVGRSELGGRHFDGSEIRDIPSGLKVEIGCCRKFRRG